MTYLVLFLVGTCLAAGTVLGLSDDDRREWAVGAAIVGVVLGVLTANSVEVLAAAPRAPFELPPIALLPLVAAAAIALVAAAITFAGAALGGRVARR